MDAASVYRVRRQFYTVRRTEGVIFDAIILNYTRFLGHRNVCNEVATVENVGVFFYGWKRPMQLVESINATDREYLRPGRRVCDLKRSTRNIT